MSSQPAAPRQGRGTFIAHGIWLVAWLLTHHHALVTAAPAVLSAGSAPEHVSVTGAGHSFLPSFSADGRSLAFVSFANNLVTNDAPKPFTDVFVRQPDAASATACSSSRAMRVLTSRC